MIKIKKLIKENYIYEIYCDMDSVLSDFDTAFLQIADVKTKDGWEYKKKFGKQKFWDIIQTTGLKFWTEMPWMKDGKKLWNYLQKLDADVRVLSAPSTHDNGESKTGKIIWCKNNLGPNVQVILEDNKFKYAGQGKILIDDLEKNIIPWKEHGGIGILHKSTSDTIQRLHKIIHNS